MGAMGWQRRLLVLFVLFVLTAACNGDSDNGNSDNGNADNGNGNGGESTTATAGPNDGSEDGWAARAEAPLAVTEVAAAAFEGELWAVGGLTADGSVSTAVQVYDPANDSWRAGPELPDPLHHAALVATDGELVVVGGYRTPRFDPVAEVLVLDAEAGEWRAGPALPEPRGAGAAAWDGARIVYGGGVGPDGLAGDVLALEDITDDGGWSRVGALSIARDHLAAASDGAGTAWFLGGRENSLERNLGTVDVVTAGGMEEGTPIPTPRGGVAAFFNPALGACLAGGEEPTGTFDEVECSGPDGTTTSLPPLTEARHGLGAAVIDGVVYVVFGGTEPGLTVSATIEALELPAE